MTIARVRSALESRLAAMTPAISTAYENAAFTPVSGTPYQKVSLLPARTVVVGQDLVTRQLTGIFQVTLCYPINGGPSNAQARADALCAHFAAGTRLTAGGARVSVEEPPSIAQGVIEGDRYVVPVSIRYISFVT